jgi:hypothetical protein
MAEFYIDDLYAHRRIKRAGGRLLYYRSKPPVVLRGEAKAYPSYWVMVVHQPADNGDGGVLYTFDRKGSKWRCTGMGRFRQSEPRIRNLFPELVAQLEENPQ